MDSRMKSLAAGSAAVAAVVGVIVFAAPRRSMADRCPPDRTIMTSMYAYDATQPPYERLSDAVAVSAHEHYRPLTAWDLVRIEEAAAGASRPSPEGRITVDPNLPDTDRVVDLIVHVDVAEGGGYLPAGGSFCARVSSGDD